MSNTSLAPLRAASHNRRYLGNLFFVSGSLGWTKDSQKLSIGACDIIWQREPRRRFAEVSFELHPTKSLAVFASGSSRISGGKYLGEWIPLRTLTQIIVLRIFHFPLEQPHHNDKAVSWYLSAFLNLRFDLQISTIPQRSSIYVGTVEKLDATAALGRSYKGTESIFSITAH